MSSLFGQGQNPPAKNLFGNLGGTPLSTSQSQPAQSAGSLFGQTPSKPAQTSMGTSLFGANSSQSQQQSQPSLFSNPVGHSKSSSSGGLFGNLGNTQSQQASTTASVNQPTTGLFGGKPATEEQLPEGFVPHGAKSYQKPNQELNGLGNGVHSGYFSSLLEKGKKRARRPDESSTFGDVPSLHLGLGDIVQRVRALGGVDSPSHGIRSGDSKAHYLLAASGVNPGTTLRDLNSLNVQTNSSVYVQQPAEWDPDSHKYVEQLQQRMTTKMIAEGIERANRSFDAYLEEHVDINWEAQRKKIYEHFGLMPKVGESFTDSTDYVNPGGKGGFGRSFRKGRGSYADRSGQSTMRRSIFSNSGMQKSVIGTPGVGSGNATLFGDFEDKTRSATLVQDNRFLRERQSQFAKKVQKLNGARLQEIVYPLLQEFSSVEGQPGGESPSQLIDAYKALIEIVRENPNANSPTAPEAIKERQYADEYLDETLNSPKAMNIRKRILEGSRRALEKQFFNHLESLISKNPQEAKLGGIPTTINKVRAYIRIRDIRKDLKPDDITLQVLNGDYCWALIFFLLRGGFVKEAADYVTSEEVSFRSLDRNFVTYITKYASTEDRRLPRQLHDRINSDYLQRSRMVPEKSLDPYRMACYKIIGRCELGKRSLENISQGVEDWTWLQFSLAREVNRVEEVASEVFGLEEVRNTIREIGQRHFQKGSEGVGGYGTFFYLQILGGLFEQAVSYLYSYSYVAAVHFAIALDFYGLFRTSNFWASESELLTYNTKQLPQINFGRMIGYYTRDFRTGNVEAAVDYLTLLCLNADLPGELGKSQASLCHEALRELVLETREFAQLLGDIRSDGTRIKGAIEQRLKLIRLADQEEFLRTVTIQAARVADDNGRTTDAVLLYHLAEDYDNVIVIINRALSDTIAVDIGSKNPRLQPLKPRSLGKQKEQQPPEGSSLSLTAVDDPVILARNMISLYNTNALYYQKIRPTNRDICGVLLRMSEAKGRVEAGQWAEALDIISSLSLLPLNANSSIPVIRSHAQTLSTLPPTISRLIGPLLLWTMTCISHQRQLLLGEGPDGSFESDTRQAMREDLVSKAKDLMVFAGLIKLRLGNGVWDGLVGGAGDVGVY